jgi:hypothetical protein
MMMPLLALCALVVGAASVATAAPCPYRGQPFSEGDVSCQDGHQFRCAGGKWEKVGTECADTDPGDAGVKLRPGVTEPAVREPGVREPSSTNQPAAPNAPEVP